MPKLLARCQAAWSAFRALERVDSSEERVASARFRSGAEPEPEIPRYPPFLKGLPVATTAQVLATQH